MKRFLGLALLCGLFASFAGCDQGAGTTDKPKDTTTPPAEKPAP